MIIKSLNVFITSELIISDVDDCLIQSSKAIKAAGFSPNQFYGDRDLYNVNKDIVFNNADLTDWGSELKHMIDNNQINPDNVVLLTSASNRFKSIQNIFKLHRRNVREGILNQDKIKYLSGLTEPAVYVDNKRIWLGVLDNKLVRCINFPKVVIQSRTRSKRINDRR